MTLIRLVILAVSLFLVLSVSGVQALWYYYLNPVESDTNISAGINVFGYKPEEVLPDSPEDNINKTNHMWLIERILNYDSYGLNETKKPILHELLNQEGDVVHCKQNVQGGNLKHIFTNKTVAEKLSFSIAWISDTEYHTYTFLDDDLDKAIIGQAGSDEILVYKTVMIKGTNGVWEAVRSYEGHAKVYRPPSGVVSRSINVDTWH